MYREARGDDGMERIKRDKANDARCCWHSPGQSQSHLKLRSDCESKIFSVRSDFT